MHKHTIRYLFTQKKSLKPIIYTSVQFCMVKVLQTVSTQYKTNTLCCSSTVYILFPSQILSKPCAVFITFSILYIGNKLS